LYVQDVITKEIYQSKVLDYSSITTDIENPEISEIQQISLYPNPAEDYLNIKLSQTKFTGELFVLDAYGKLIRKIEIQAHTELIQLLLNSYKPGMYIIQYKNEKGLLTTEKFIKR
jgi:hypothetical protein